MNNYKKNISPFDLIFAQVYMTFRNKNKKDLITYCNWYVNSIPERITILQNTINGSSEIKWVADFTPESLSYVGVWFKKHMKMRKMTKEEKEEIYKKGPEWFKQVDIGDEDFSGETQSIIIDISMYLSQVFLKNIPKLEWYFHLSGSKINVNYGQPVIMGFKGKVMFNPLSVTIGVGYGLADNTDNPDKLRELFYVWSKMVA